MIGAAHVALQGVNEQLIKGIENMKEGKASDFTLDPSPIRDWSADAGDTSVFAGTWEAIKAVLEKMMDATSPASVMGVALAGVINNGDDIVKSLGAGLRLSGRRGAGPRAGSPASSHRGARTRKGPASQDDAGPSLILVGTAGFEPATP